MAELTGKTIAELPTATELNNGDYFVIYQNAATKKVAKEIVLPDTGWVKHPDVNFAQYRKVGNIVFLKIVSNNDVPLLPEGQALCYMPVGFRPTAQTDLALTNAGGTSAVFMRIDPDGLVSGFGSPATTYCSGIGCYPV